MDGMQGQGQPMESQGQGQGEQVDPMTIISGVAEGLSGVTKMLADLGAPPEIVQQLEQITQAYMQTIDAMMGQGQGQGPSGPQPMEGASGGVPMGPQGV